MSALGNDFAVFRSEELPNKATVQAIADRRNGIGCDQVIVLSAAADPTVDIHMRAYNRDGSKAENCGNAARAVALLLAAESDKSDFAIATDDRILDAELVEGGVRVDMGIVRRDWRDIPLSKPMDTMAMPLEVGELKQPSAINVGNPHAVFLVEDVTKIPLEKLGGRVENHPFFPQKTNVEMVSAEPECLRARVWERGVGITPACGSGACAALVAAAAKGVSPRKNIVKMEGGDLTVEWLADNHVLMSGAAQLNFSGRIPPGTWQSEEK